MDQVGTSNKDLPAKVMKQTRMREVTRSEDFTRHDDLPEELPEKFTWGLGKNRNRQTP